MIITECMEVLLVKLVLTMVYMVSLIQTVMQVFLMEQYQANNPWYSSAFDTSTASELSTALLGQGIGMGLGFGVVVGFVVAKLLARRR